VEVEEVFTGAGLALPAIDDVWNAYVRAVGEPARGFSTTVSTSTEVFTSIRHNVNVDDSIFEMPARPPQN